MDDLFVSCILLEIRMHLEWTKTYKINSTGKFSRNSNYTTGVSNESAHQCEQKQ